MKMDPKVASIISSWSLKEKVGQLFILAFPGKSAEQARTMIVEYNLGGCYLSQDNGDTFAEAQQLTRELASIGAEQGRLPLLLGVDQEGAWGVLVGESTTGPGNLALGVAETGQGPEARYKAMAEEMRLAGFKSSPFLTASVSLLEVQPRGLDSLLAPSVPPHRVWTAPRWLERRIPSNKLSGRGGRYGAET